MNQTDEKTLGVINATNGLSGRINNLYRLSPSNGEYKLLVLEYNMLVERLEAYKPEFCMCTKIDEESIPKP